MTPKGEETKGRIKEAVGDLADDPQLKRQGKRDRAAAKAKEKANKVIDKAREKVEDLT